GGYREWLHGEAVAVGMVFAAALAVESGLLDEGTFARHLTFLEGLGLPISVDLLDPGELLRVWSIDKKYRGGQRWVLLKGIGEPVVSSDVEGEAVLRAMNRVLRG
ncbi:MAG: 3-dehydroquinate synthase family protein, partial [Acidimicrobiales bacterium]